MSKRFVMLKSKVTHDHLATDQDHFDKHLKRKKLEVIYESKSGYIRVKDQQEEDFGLFPGQYKNI